MSHAAWSVKHKPRSLGEVVGNKETIQKLVDWVKSWDAGLPKKRAAFIYGPTGIGKTVAVEALARDFKMDLVENNASDYRTEEAINHFVGLASQFSSLLGGKRIILLDELDGLTGTSDRGGVKAITHVVKDARYPIVLTANSAYDPRFSSLRTYCLMFEFKKPSIGEVAKYLKGVCEDEDIQAEEAALKFIAQRSEGDIRSAVNDLQALAQGKKKLGYEDVSWLGYRDRQESIFSVLKLIMYAKTCVSAKQALDMADVDVDMVFEWIYENVPDHLNDPRDLAEGMAALSMADVYRGRIRASHDWSFMRYVVDYMTAGVAMARRYSRVSGWAPFRFPGRIQMLSRSRFERAAKLSIGQKVKRKCHISARRATREFIPYLRIIFKNNSEMAAGIAKWLDLDVEMIGNLVEDKNKAEAIAKLLT